MPDFSPSAVRLSQGPDHARFMLRGRPADAGFAAACRSVLGGDLPLAGQSLCWPGGTVLWFGPDAWLVLAAPGAGGALGRDLARAVTGCGALVDVSAAWVSRCVEGPAMRDVLARGCALDLDAAQFGPGRCARSRLGPFPVLLHHRADIAAFEIHVARSYGAALGRWLDDVAALLSGGAAPGR